jgi:hypothetical protein
MQTSQLAANNNTIIGSYPSNPFQQSTSIDITRNLIRSSPSSIHAKNQPPHQVPLCATIWAPTDSKSNNIHSKGAGKAA